MAENPKIDHNNLENYEEDENMAHDAK